MPKKLWKVLKYLLSVLLAALLVYFACKGIDWKQFLDGLKATRWFWMAMFFAATYMAIVFRAQRWKQLLKPLDPNIKYGKVWDATNVGNLCSIAIPASGDFVRCGMVTTATASYEKVFGTIVMERTWDVVAILLMFAAALLMGWSHFGGFFVDNVWHPLTSKATILWILLALALIAFGTLKLIYYFKDKSKLAGKIVKTINGLVQGFKSFGSIHNKVPFLLYTVGIWTMYMLMSYFVLKAIPELSHLSLQDGLFICALGNIASVVPVPGGIGAYHYLLKVSLTTLYGVSEEIGLLYATLNHESRAVMLVILGAWSYIMRVMIMKNHSAAENRAAKQKK